MPYLYGILKTRRWQEGEGFASAPIQGLTGD